MDKASKLAFFQRETKRQRVARELVLQRSGKPLPDDNKLLRQYTAPKPSPAGFLSAISEPSVLEVPERQDNNESESDYSSAEEREHSQDHSHDW